MTAQIMDRFLYDGQEYFIAEHRGDALPNPNNFGIMCIGTSTADHRGFVLTMALRDGYLVLHELVATGYLRTEDKKPPLLNGKMPDVGSAYEGQRFVYSDVRLRVDFTGELGIGADLDDREYFHGGTQALSAFRLRRRLKFEKGKLLEDREALLPSEQLKQMAQARMKELAEKKKLEDIETTGGPGPGGRNPTEDPFFKAMREQKAKEMAEANKAAGEFEERERLDKEFQEAVARHREKAGQGQKGGNAEEEEMAAAMREAKRLKEELGKAPAPAEGPKCHACGASVKARAKFCPECGSKL